MSSDTLKNAALADLTLQKSALGEENARLRKECRRWEQTVIELHDNAIGLRAEIDRLRRLTLREHLEAWWAGRNYKHEASEL